MVFIVQRYTTRMIKLINLKSSVSTRPGCNTKMLIITIYYTMLQYYT